jgi:hypothetical protein
MSSRPSMQVLQRFEPRHLQSDARLSDHHYSEIVQQYTQRIRKKDLARAYTV